MSQTLQSSCSEPCAEPCAEDLAQTGVVAQVAAGTDPVTHSGDPEQQAGDTAGDRAALWQPGRNNT